jgi:hypothetical protein
VFQERRADEMLRVPPENAQDTVFLDSPYPLLAGKMQGRQSLNVALAEFIEPSAGVVAEPMDGHGMVLALRVSENLPPRH